MTSPGNGATEVPNTAERLAYRPEVDGLRALAVLSVMAYHLRSDVLPGGFLGVDVFFVISGYVISASLMRQPPASLFDLLAGFYARRIKRLLPALLVCVLVTCLLAALFMSPGQSEQKASLRAGTYALFGLSNVYFYDQATDYFAGAAALNLFTHTWSLGVEEQFYFMFPALLWAIADRSRKFQATVLSALAVGSFGLFLGSTLAGSSAAYFLMPPRFWELGAVCLIALREAWYGQPWPPAASESLAAWLAMAALGLALTAPAGNKLWTTPLAVAGTVVLIVTLPRSRMLTAALTRRAVLTIGLMSYSLYLWHWSLLVLTRWTIGLSPKTAPFLLAATFAVAALSYRHIERPMRHTRWFPTKLATVGRGAVVTVIAAALVMGINKNVTRALYAGHGLHTSEFSLLADKRIGDAVRWRARDCVLASHRDVGKSISAEACTLRLPAQNASRQFLVVGNSSNVAQFEMVSSIVEQGLGSMTLVSSWGAMPIPELVGGDKVWRESNFDFWNRVVPELLRRLVRGDVLVMISDMVPNLPAVPGAADHQAFATMERVLDALAAELNVRGIAILFQAPMTFLRDAGCTPEMGRPQWFR